MVKVLIADKLPREIYEPRFLEAGIEFLDGVSRADLETVIADCEGMIVRSDTLVTGSLLDKAPKLRLIARAGTGYDTIDLDEATYRRTLVINTPFENIQSAAEHTIALIYALCRNIPSADASLKSGGWDRNRFTGTELMDKRMGIIGFGRVGRIVAGLAKGNNMEVVFYDPYVSQETAKSLGYESLGLDELLGTSDFITLHVMPTEDTKHMMGEREFGLMKPSARFFNVARGSLVDDDALYNAILQGKIAGAGIDVFETEPYNGNLLTLGSKVVVTPHIGALTREAQRRVAEAITRQVIAYFNRGEIIYPVNVKSPSAEIEPYMDLVQRMGYLAGKLADGNVKGLKVRCYGQLADVNTSGIATIGLVGLLSSYLGNEVNLVNAPKLADERGITFSERTSKESIDYRALVSLEVSVEGKESITIQGILYEKRGPRIVALNGYDIEFEPYGNLLITSHGDVPSVAAHITSVVGKHNVNIATINLSREAKGDVAIGVFRVDSPVPDMALREITAPSKNVYKAQQIAIPDRLSPIL